MINVADCIELHSFQNDLLDDPFTKLYKEKQKNIHEALTKQYGSNVLADLIINQYAS
jgi:hypothetical protein